MMDVSNMDKIIAEREKTKREQMEYEHMRELRREQDARRPGRIKACIVLGVIGLVMCLGGWFAGAASGDHNSPFYMVTMLGMFPLFAIPVVWLSGMESK